MPSAPFRYCLEPNCPTKVQGAPRCHIHTRQHQARYEALRGTASQRGYGAAWSRYRAAFLEEHWYCGSRPYGLPETGDSQCRKQGLWKKANVVDHIVPVTGPEDPTFYQAEAHQALCDTCHQVKRQREGIQGRKSA